MVKTKLRYSAIAAVALTLAASPALAENAPGVTDTEIKIGNTNPYSGPASAYGTIGKTIAAYFNKVNEEGGINGRKINFLSYDDGYSPPKTVEQVRKLVESDEVALLFQTLGTPTNSAIHKYVNAKKVPHLFVATGATKWGQPDKFPWTMGWQPNYQSEGRIYAQYIQDNKADGKIAVLYQNDDYGKDVLQGLKDGLGDKAESMIVAEATYETSNPTVDAEVVQLKSSGADVFVLIATPKFAAQAIRKVAEIGWDAMKIVNQVSASVGAVLKPAGLENAKDWISTGYLKDATDPAWDDDEGMKNWRAFMDKYYPDGDQTSSFTTYGYAVAQTMVKVLEQAGDDLSRENIMKQAASISDYEQELLLPGIKINTGEGDFFPIEQMQMMKFDGERWEYFGDVIEGKIS